MARTADQNWAKGYSIPWNVVPVNKLGGTNCCPGMGWVSNQVTEEGFRDEVLRFKWGLSFFGAGKETLLKCS